MQNTNENEAYSAIEALEECVHACSDCASHDIREGGIVECALICLDCADICSATLKAMARHSAHHPSRRLRQACGSHLPRMRDGVFQT